MPRVSPAQSKHPEHRRRENLRPDRRTKSFGASQGNVALGLSCQGTRSTTGRTCIGSPAVNALEPSSWGVLHPSRAVRALEASQWQLANAEHHRVAERKHHAENIAFSPRNRGHSRHRRGGVRPARAVRAHQAWQSWDIAPSPRRQRAMRTRSRCRSQTSQGILWFRGGGGPPAQPAKPTRSVAGGCPIQPTKPFRAKGRRRSPPPNGLIRALEALYGAEVASGQRNQAAPSIDGGRRIEPTQERNFDHGRRTPHA